MNEIAANIKNLRKEKGISQEQFAQALHVTRQTVSAWERGLSLPGLDTLGQIARVLEVEPERLLYGKEKGKKLRYHRVSYWPVLGVIPGGYCGIVLLGMLFGRFLGGGDAAILICGQILLGMLIVFCTCLILDEIRNREYYEKNYEDFEEDPKK